jgi:hypothetical protein
MVSLEKLDLSGAQSPIEGIFAGLAVGPVNTLESLLLSDNKWGSGRKASLTASAAPCPGLVRSVLLQCVLGLTSASAE